LEISLSTILKLFAPFLPFTTEEIWSWSRSDSIHTSNWPTVYEVLSPLSHTRSNIENISNQQYAEKYTRLIALCSIIMEKIRKKKSEANVSIKTPVDKVIIAADYETIGLISLAQNDLSGAGNVTEFIYNEVDSQEVNIDVLIKQ